jgi:hypothetical protein
MGVIELFSKRQKAQRKAGQPDVFQYENVPNELRVQIVHILRDAIGIENSDCNHCLLNWELIHNTMAREKGVLSLATYHRNPRLACEDWFLTTATNDDASDFIELCARVIDRVVRGYSSHDRMMHNISMAAADAMEELNQRFR